jgi:hypothetical protein
MKDDRHLLIIDTICSGWQPAEFEDDEPVFATSKSECIHKQFEACYDDIAKMYYEMKNLYTHKASSKDKALYLENNIAANPNEYVVSHIADFIPGTTTAHIKS